MDNSKHCSVCNPENATGQICEDCRICVLCDMLLDEEIDETNWIPVKRHCHDSQVWSVEEDYELLCNSCKAFRCNRCTETIVRGNMEIIGMCSNRCETCGWACDDEECDC